MINTHVLDGCRPTLMSSYLKAMGIFRIVATQLDPDVTACWQDDRFVLRTRMDRKDILQFMADRYIPTPVIAPWSYSVYRQTVGDISSLLDNARFAPYRDVIDKITRAENEFCSILGLDQPGKKTVLDNKSLFPIEEWCRQRNIDSKKTVLDNKSLFLRLCRNNFPDDAIAYFDAVFALKDKIGFAPMAGSGMNDGRFDMAKNFATYVTMLFGDSPTTNSETWLRSAFFAEAVPLHGAAMVGHNPDAAGGPNSGEGFEGKPLLNPWEYVLMIEGIMLFAGNMARRQSGGSSSGSKAAFPFSTHASNVGYATASNGEDARGEIWLPVWDNHATYREMTHVFGEGRVQLNGRQAATGTEFARAMIGMGTERGITDFRRFCVMKRKGDAYLYIHAGKMRTGNEPLAVLLNDLDVWYGYITNQSRKKGATATLIRLTREFDSAMMQFCQYRTRNRLLALLITIGRLERYVSAYEDLKPLQKLSFGWLEACYDGSAEYRLAASVSSIRASGNVGSIRENLEGVKHTSGMWEQDKDSKHFVWKENAGLLKNMADILQRRALDGKIQSLDHIPIDGTAPARIGDIVRFLNGELDMEKINDLILPLSIITAPEGVAGHPWDNTIQRHEDHFAVPEQYILIKSIHPPDSDYDIPYDLSVLELLHARRPGDAYARAQQILHAHGLSPWSYANTGSASHGSFSNTVKEHVMAALLFPISSSNRRKMTDMVMKPREGEAG